MMCQMLAKKLEINEKDTVLALETRTSSLQGARQKGAISKEFNVKEARKVLADQ